MHSPLSLRSRLRRSPSTLGSLAVPLRAGLAGGLRRGAALGLLAALTIASGCYQSRMPFERCAASLRNQHLAKSAWCARSGCYDGLQECLCDFKRGFKDGYVAAIEGKDRTPPSIAPRRYHGLFYCSDGGKCCEAAWFDGWEHGRVAAEQDGAAGLYTVQLRCPCKPCNGSGFADPHAPYSPYAQPMVPTHTVSPLDPSMPAMPGAYPPVDLAPGETLAPAVLPEATLDGVPAVPSEVPATPLPGADPEAIYAPGLGS